MKTGLVENTTYTTQATAQRDGDAASTVTVTVETERENTDQVAINWKEWQEQQKQKEELPVMNYSDMVAKYQVKVSKPTDSSGQLTQRLVAASTDFEVQNVIAKASSSMISLRMIAAMGEGEDKEKARQYLRKLEKVMDRASGKLKDLRNETDLDVQRRRAEKQKETRRAEEIKAELRQRRRVRKSKEERWLREAQLGEMPGFKPAGKAPDDSADRLDAATEAEIAIEAEAMAAAEVSAESVGGGADVGGGEVASGGGGEAAVEAPVADAGGSVDISV